ncbi:MAG TPA: ABC transporter permease [Anaerolineales bacterium]|nr:ABC transporter permease [Anaerolineales bacterium]
MTMPSGSLAPRRSIRPGGRIVWIRRIGFFLGLVALWEALALLRLWPTYLFPTPGQVLESLARGFRDGTFLIGIRGSLGRLIEGYLISLVVGLTLGLLMARLRWVKDTLGLVVMGMQALPSICWLPLALLWFGLNPSAILFVVVMGSVLSIAQATEDGVRNTPPIYLRAASNLGARGWQLYPRVILPSALPSIITGMKLGWSFAWRSLMAGELLYTLPGLGALLTMGRELNDMSRVVAVMLVIITVGLLTDQLLFGQVERRVRDRWGLAGG